MPRQVNVLREPADGKNQFLACQCEAYLAVSSRDKSLHGLNCGLEICYKTWIAQYVGIQHHWYFF